LREAASDCAKRLREPDLPTNQRSMRRVLLYLAIVLVPIAVFAAMVLVDRQLGGPGRGYDYVVSVDLPPAEGIVGLPEVLGPMDSSRPLVVIDPGHGGKDPGAGTGKIIEKEITLAIAQALRDELLKAGGVRVALTRSDDRYLFLGERSSIARRLGADLFISIHADSSEDVETGATGATIYTLSEKGSSEVAERMAARENAADMIDGVKLAAQDKTVGAILVDLSQRETQARSEQFAQLLLREGRGELRFKVSENQSAAFVVLKAPDVPSVLFESGYLNNPADAQRLASAAGRQTIAEVTARAIRVHFARTAPIARTAGFHY
jgi:N-acetylmuramoyl-L-alanine amidase